MSTGFLRVDVPNRLVRSAAQKAHPASAAQGGYNQYPILRQFGEFDLDTAYAFNNATTVAQAQRFCWRHGRASIPTRTSRFCPTGSSPIRGT